MINNNVINLLQKKYKLTQHSIAKILEVRNTAVSNYALGKRQVKYQQLEKIANHFKIPITELLNDNINPSFDKINNGLTVNNILLEEVVKKYNQNNHLIIKEITNNLLYPHFKIGDTLVIDTEIAEFNLEGYYLVSFNNTNIICKVLLVDRSLLFKTNESEYSSLTPKILGKVILSLRKEN